MQYMLRNLTVIYQPFTLKWLTLLHSQSRTKFNCAKLLILPLRMGGVITIGGAGGFWSDGELEGRAIVNIQWLAPPFFCLLSAYSFPAPSTIDQDYDHHYQVLINSYALPCINPYCIVFFAYYIWPTLYVLVHFCTTLQLLLVHLLFCKTYTALPQEPSINKLCFYLRLLHILISSFLVIILEVTTRLKKKQLLFYIYVFRLHLCLERISILLIS